MRLGYRNQGRMKIGIVKEMLPGECRVAAVPDTVKKMVNSGFKVLIESGSGILASIDDIDYKNAGATIMTTNDQVLQNSDINLKVQPPIYDYISSHQETFFMKENAIIIGLLAPINNPDIIDKLNDKKITVFSLDLLPRNTDNQLLDAFGAMSKIAGYKSVIIAAYYLGKVIPPLSFADTTTPKTRVLIFGAGIAGQTAITTAKQLDSMVTVIDVNNSVSEQVKKLGAEFVHLNVPYQSPEGREIISQHIKASDIVIASAHVPGHRAPLYY